MLPAHLRRTHIIRRYWSSLSRRSLLVNAGWTPARLFAAGEQGLWYDPSDLSTLFQDAGGTTPVTTVGQTVALMLDKSGRGNHLTMTNCTLGQDGLGNYYIFANGTATGVTSAINFTGTDAITVVTGIRKLSDAAATGSGSLIELGNNSGLLGQFILIAPNGAASNYFWRSVGSAISSIVAAPYVAPLSNVLAGVADISADFNTLHVNNDVHVDVADQGVGNYRNDVIYFFKRGAVAQFFNGWFYGAVVRGALTNVALVQRAKAYQGKKMGIIL